MIDLYKANSNLKNNTGRDAQHFVIWDDDTATPCRHHKDLEFVKTYKWNPSLGHRLYIINIKLKEKKL